MKNKLPMNTPRKPTTTCTMSSGTGTNMRISGAKIEPKGATPKPTGYWRTLQTGTSDERIEASLAINHDTGYERRTVAFHGVTEAPEAGGFKVFLPLLQCSGQGRALRRRRALPMTIRSERPMAAAHRTGLMKPSAAKGMPA